MSVLSSIFGNSSDETTETTLEQDHKRFFGYIKSGNITAVQDIVSRCPEALRWQRPEGEGVLLTAYENDRAEMFEALLVAGADCHEEVHGNNGRYSQVPIMTYMIIKNKIPYIIKLLEHGANPNKEGYWPSDYSIHSGTAYEFTEHFKRQNLKALLDQKNDLRKNYLARIEQGKLKGEVSVQQDKTSSSTPVKLTVEQQLQIFSDKISQLRSEIDQLKNENTDLRSAITQLNEKIDNETESPFSASKVNRKSGQAHP